MSFRKTAALLLLLASMASALASDSWFARPWRTDDGLPDNSISGIAQTPDGFLWVGTPGGLARFDGSRFEEFSTTNLSSHTIRALTLDHSGRLWLGTDRGGVMCVGNDSEQIFGAKDGLPDSVQKMMVVDGENAVWICHVGVHGGISRIKDGKVTIFDTNDGLPRSGNFWLTTDVHGQLWFARSGNVGVFRDGRFQILQNVGEGSISIAGARAGGIWICTPNRLLKLDESNHLQDFGTLPQPGVGGGQLFESSDGAVWIGTGRAYGLFRFDGKHFERIPTTHPVVNCLAEDREGNIWVGTAGGGLDRLRPKVLDLLDAGTQPFESIHSICEDTGGNLWAVNRDGVLTRGQNENRATVSDFTNWPSGRASCVAADPRGGVWIGTHGEGLYHFQNNQFTAFGRDKGLINNSVRSLLAASNGDLWIGCDPAHLQRLHDGKFTTFNLPENARLIRALAEDSQGNIWAATSEGLLARISGTNVVNETPHYLSQPISIRCLCATDDGSLWIGYADGGLGRIQDGKYSRLTTAQGLDDNSISQIIADDQGWLWLCGSRGFFRIRLQQLNDVADGSANHLRAVVFGRGEGLPGLQANFDNFPAAFRGHDGRLRVATHTGVAVINPQNIRDNLNPPPVFVERTMVDGQTVGRYDNNSPLRPVDAGGTVDLKNMDAKLSLPPDYHRLEFDFTALSFTAPENVQFRYKLDGLDENWIEAGTERSASYSRLPAGNYRFHVVACNNSIVWSPDGATLSFTVRPFFWQTWWFRTIILAAFTLAIAALVRYVSFRRLHFRLRLLEQQAALDKERARIARDLHDDLGGSLTQVGLLLDMAQRNHNGNGNGDDNGDEMQKCSTMVRRVATSVDEIIWAINPRNDTAPYLVDYISQFVVEFLHAAGIQCRVHLPNDIPKKNISPEARHNLFLVVKEALNNIARHAQATEVHFRAAADNEQISIVIEDNGHGFERAPNGATADGLRNMKQRMEEIGGQFQIESKSETGPSSAVLRRTGTRVSFIYPWPEK